ncbi:unnamed protein product [Effrenium voratum]|nr:unnamed protein product [Effrenium voratum]
MPRTPQQDAPWRSAAGSYRDDFNAARHRPSTSQSIEFGHPPIQSYTSAMAETYSAYLGRSGLSHRRDLSCAHQWLAIQSLAACDTFTQRVRRLITTMHLELTGLTASMRAKARTMGTTLATLATLAILGLPVILDILAILAILPMPAMPAMPAIPAILGILDMPAILAILAMLGILAILAILGMLDMLGMLGISSLRATTARVMQSLGMEKDMQCLPARSFMRVVRLPII